MILWREQFAEQDPESLWKIAPGRGRKPTYGADKVQAVIAATLQTKPKGTTHWSCRRMAQEQGLSKSKVSNLWHSHNLRPHRVKRFKLSRDPRFLEKLTDVVGLYLNPPQQALVLCVDEKSQIQAHNRTQPGLPLKQGRCGTMTHDYQRHGTATLFPALELAQGRVIGQCQQRHRNQGFLKFLRWLDQEFPGKVFLHLVWFGELTAKRARRGSFFSVEELHQAIREFLAAWNQAPQPFVWTATVDSITAKLSHCRQTLELIELGCTLPRTRSARCVSHVAVLQKPYDIAEVKATLAVPLWKKTAKETLIKLFNFHWGSV